MSDTPVQPIPSKDELRHEVALRELGRLTVQVVRLENLCQQIAGGNAEPKGPADPAIPPLAGFLAGLPVDLGNLSKRLSEVDVQLRSLLF